MLTTLVNFVSTLRNIYIPRILLFLVHKYYCSQVSLNYRGDSSSGSAAVGERLLSTLLTEMDGLEEAKVSFLIL